MKKNCLLIGCLFTAFKLTAQVGVNTITPNATLEISSLPSELNFVDGLIAPKLTGEELKAKENLYGNDQIGTVIYVTKPATTKSIKTNKVKEAGYYYFDGSIWQKIRDSRDLHERNVDVENGLSIAGGKIKLGGALTQPTTINTSQSNTLQLTGLQKKDSESSQFLMTDVNGVLHTADREKQDQSLINKNSLPAPAIFQLARDTHNFLSAFGAGNAQLLNLVEVKNAISGLTYNARTNTITFPIGTYQISFVYESTHDAPNCTVSSYYMEFPTTNVTALDHQRVHSTSTHSQGVLSNHGGVISFTARVTQQRDWRFSLGRGVSGNCSGAGMTLRGVATQIMIYRLGD